MTVEEILITKIGLSTLVISLLVIGATAIGKEVIKTRNRAWNSLHLLQQCSLWIFGLVAAGLICWALFRAIWNGEYQ